MPSVSVTTTKPIRLEQLSAELGVIVGGAGAGPITLNGSGNIGDPGDTTSKTVSTNEDATVTQAQLQQAVNAHAFNPDFGLSAAQLRLRNNAATLRTWGSQARAVGASNSNVSQAELDTLFTRTGTVFERLADMLEVLALDS